MYSAPNSRSFPCVCRTVYTQFHHVEPRFLELSTYGFYAKTWAKTGSLDYLYNPARPSRILKRFGLACTRLMMCLGRCFHVSSPNLEWFTREDFKTLYYTSYVFSLAQLVGQQNNEKQQKWGGLQHQVQYKNTRRHSYLAEELVASQRDKPRNPGTILI